jgi:hypothetical protein
MTVMLILVAGWVLTAAAVIAALAFAARPHIPTLDQAEEHSTEPETNLDQQSTAQFAEFQTNHAP